MTLNWLLPAFISLFCFGLWGFLTKLATLYIDEKSGYIYQGLGVAIIALILLVSMKFKPASNPKGLLLALCSGLATGAGCVAYFYAASKGKISTVVTLAALYPVITIILAFLILQETIHPKQAIGIVFALIAIYLMA